MQPDIISVFACETLTKPAHNIARFRRHLFGFGSLAQCRLVELSIPLELSPFIENHDLYYDHPTCGPTERKEILDGMLGSSLVVFQTYSYARHFSSSCVRVCGYESAPTGIDVKGALTTVMHCPVGIDAERVEREIGLREGPHGTSSSSSDQQQQQQHHHHGHGHGGIKAKMSALRALYQGKKIIVARDKLDVVKGITQKLQAFEKLLADYPQWRGNVVMIQVTSPALSDSPKLERQVSELVARVNGEFGSLDFVPVHH